MLCVRMWLNVMCTYVSMFDTLPITVMFVFDDGVVMYMGFVFIFYFTFKQF